MSIEQLIGQEKLVNLWNAFSEDNKRIVSDFNSQKNNIAGLEENIEFEVNASEEEKALLIKIKAKIAVYESE